LPLKIDLGAVIPGLLFFIFGIVLFIIWIFGSVFSYFIFNVPYLQLLLIISLLLIAAGLIQIFSGISGIFGKRKMD